MRIQFFTAASVEMAFFCHVVPCSLTETDWRFRGLYCVRLQGYKFKSTSPHIFESKVLSHWSTKWNHFGNCTRSGWRNSLLLFAESSTQCRHRLKAFICYRLSEKCLLTLSTGHHSPVFPYRKLHVLDGTRKGEK